MAILVKLAVCAVFAGEGLLSWLYLTGRRQQDLRSPYGNQLGIAMNAALIFGVLIWL